MMIKDIFIDHMEKIMEDLACKRSEDGYTTDNFDRALALVNAGYGSLQEFARILNDRITAMESESPYCTDYNEALWDVQDLIDKLLEEYDR